MTWESEPTGLWEREEDSWRTWNRQRGGSSFNKPGAGAGADVGLAKRQFQRAAPGLNPGLAVYSPTQSLSCFICQRAPCAIWYREGRWPVGGHGLDGPAGA